MQTTDVLKSLFSGPLEAVTDAEARFRTIRARWIRQKLDLMDLADDEEIPDGLFESAQREASRTLETTLVALYKTFSRVSGRSHEVPPDQPLPQQRGAAEHKAGQDRP